MSWSTLVFELRRTIVLLLCHYSEKKRQKYQHHRINHSIRARVVVSTTASIICARRSGQRCPLSPFENSEGLLSWAQGKWSARKKKKLVREKLRLLCQQSKQSGCKNIDTMSLKQLQALKKEVKPKKRKH